MKIEDYNEYYIQGSDHYLIPKDVFKELFGEMENWREEAKELNKQLENTINSYTEEHNMRHNSDLELDILKEQQKRFMNYLNDSIRELEEENTDTIGNALNSSIIVIIKAVLRNYKEIIGDDK